MAAVQVISAQAVGARDGQAAAGDHLHDSPHLCLRVPHELQGTNCTWSSVWAKYDVKKKIATLLQFHFMTQMTLARKQ